MKTRSVNSRKLRVEERAPTLERILFDEKSNELRNIGKIRAKTKTRG